MAQGLNKVILIGNLGKDPEVFKMDNGTKKASFSLATSEIYKNKDGEKITHTEWHNIVAWKGLAEIVENYLKKGSVIYMEGRLRKREYENKDGEKKVILEIVMDTLNMLGGGTQKEDSVQLDVPAIPSLDDDLPF